ncbi:N-acetylglucosamine-6-phosphate deacetylase [Angustibacter sp. McL0619]|uniref:N-acetylglucosamine-6-phosphate deacetylase n=1 Tax=Angustibacter sp. McL0619 TaxID=3415676 RepID=UPI003CFAD200
MSAGDARRLGVARAVVDDVLVEGDVEVADGLVTQVGLTPAGTGTAVPGLVDLQVNGYAGVDLLEADAGGWQQAAAALARDGVTAFVANLVTAPPERTRAALSHVDSLAAGAATSGTGARGGDGPRARLLGAALEGPFLSPQRAGVHAPEHLRSPDVAELAALVGHSRVTGMTIAPDLPGALEVIRWAVDRGMLVSLGHSGCGAVAANAGFNAGARTVTHLFNAMAPITAREPGLAGTALSRSDVVVQLICDGVHLADESLRVALTAARGGWVLITDAMAAAGQGDGRYELGGRTVTVAEGVARDPDGVIAGSVSTLAGAVREVVRVGASELDAIRAVTSRPARLLGVELARVRPGDRADVVVLDDDLEVTRVLVHGREVA